MASSRVADPNPLADVPADDATALSIKSDNRVGSEEEPSDHDSILPENLVLLPALGGKDAEEHWNNFPSYTDTSAHQEIAAEQCMVGHQYDHGARLDVDPNDTDSAITDISTA
ncbi:hypothetical protein BP6252_11249 [Coleophoma cylindrospora]|uniref:Uncharacterized protein n=1 Tax=Coleophoma cylindrospora TaxID=1849047 RepID=A0A3D8QQE8_9HELO|nr:hypothetical protein BP6252_11249 [Coleophoma cylindrospora]